MVYLAKALELRNGDREALEALTRGKSVTSILALRARTVLLAADGMSNIQIEKTTGFSAPTVLKWRNRYIVAAPAGVSLGILAGAAGAFAGLTGAASWLACQAGW